jgi:mannose-6-phosphate isomerase
MAVSSLGPLRFEPILRRLIWGGRRLGTLLHKPIGEGDDYAESWEIADYRDAVSVVCEGELAGTSLRALVQNRGRELLGPALDRGGPFPLLVKFIDARETLSVQVHPNNEQGQRLAGDSGKTETWVIVAAEPGSLIYAGLSEGVTRERFAAAIATGKVEPLLHHFPARPGDCIMVDAGTVHAIGAGVLLAEIQQMSDATFRVHDWGRVGPDGRPRQLHLEQAMESIDFARGPVGPLVPESEPTADGILRERLSSCPYFALERWKLRAPLTLGSADRFTIVMCLEGAAMVQHAGRELGAGARLAFGQTLLLPAAAGACTVTPAPHAVVLSCVVP